MYLNIRQLLFLEYKFIIEIAVFFDCETVLFMNAERWKEKYGQFTKNYSRYF